MTRLVVLVFACLAGGCGSRTATVTGNVTVGGKPLSAGTVQVKDATGEVRLATVTDGKFTVDGIARGPAKLGVVPGMVGSESKGPSRAFGQYGRARAKGEEPVASIPADHQRPESSPYAVQIDRSSVTVEIIIP